MKLKLVLIAVIFLCVSGFADAQIADANKKQISVLGSVELKEVADEATFYFTIKGVGESLKKSVEEAEKKTKDVTDKLLNIGVKKSDIATSDFMSGENSDDKAFLSSSRDYKATIVTKIKTDNMSLLKPLLFTISESAVENISDISFSYKEEVGLRRRARIEAAQKAKEKADDLAAPLGIKVGKVIMVDELQTTLYNSKQMQSMRMGIAAQFNAVGNGFSNDGSMDESKGTGFFAQTISVTSQVRVVFEIE